MQPLWKRGLRFLKKLKVGLPYDPAIPLLGVYLDKTVIQKYTCIPVFIAALFTIAKTQKQPKCPSTEEWIKKMAYIRIMEYSSVMSFPGGSAVKKKSTYDVGDTGVSGSVPESGKSPGRGHGNPLQYSCLESPMDGGAWRATVHVITKSWT